jgi:hypothetical protein
MDRLNMVSVDDALIDITERGQVYGFLPTIVAVENLIPHAIWNDKPNAGFGNTYAHELGMLSDDDTTTGISFSAMSEVFHEGKWLGILIFLPVLLIMMFSAADSITGDLRISPWGFAYTVIFLHTGPEGDCSALLYVTFYTSFILITTVYTARFVLPIVGAFFAPEKRVFQLMRKPQSIPRGAAVSAAPKFQPGTIE